MWIFTSDSSVLTGIITFHPRYVGDCVVRAEADSSQKSSHFLSDAAGSKAAPEDVYDDSTRHFSLLDLQHMGCPHTTHHGNAAHCSLLCLRFCFKINDIFI